MKFMKNAEEMENKLSIVSNSTKRQEIISRVPKLTIKPPGINNKIQNVEEIISVIGPSKDSLSQTIGGAATGN